VIDAWMVSTRVGTPVRAGRRVTAALGLDLLSGDAPSSPTRHGAFDTLYGSNHSFYGFADIAGGNPASTLKGRGIADALATSMVVVSKRPDGGAGPERLPRRRRRSGAGSRAGAAAARLELSRADGDVLTRRLAAGRVAAEVGAPSPSSTRLPAPPSVHAFRPTRLLPLGRRWR
jgi:hypothetical protein